MKPGGKQKVTVNFLTPLPTSVLNDAAREVTKLVLSLNTKSLYKPIPGKFLLLPPSAQFPILACNARETRNKKAAEESSSEVYRASTLERQKKKKKKGKVSKAPSR